MTRRRGVGEGGACALAPILPVAAGRVQPCSAAGAAAGTDRCPAPAPPPPPAPRPAGNPRAVTASGAEGLRHRGGGGEGGGRGGGEALLGALCGAAAG